MKQEKYEYLRDITVSRTLTRLKEFVHSNPLELTEKLLQEAIDNATDEQYKLRLLVEILRIREIQDYALIAKQWLYGDKEMQALQNDNVNEFLTKVDLYRGET